MYVRRVELTDFRSYAHAEVDFEPGPSVLVGPNGVRQDQPDRGARVRGDARQPSGGHRPPLVRAGAERGHHPVRRSCTTSGNCSSSWRLVPGKANRARLGRAPAAGPGTSSARSGWCCSPRRISPWSAAIRPSGGATSTICWSQRQPRFAGVRADYERVLKQRNALLRTAYLARKVAGRAGDLSTLDVWDTHLAAHGADLLAARLDLCAALWPARGQGVRRGERRPGRGSDRVRGEVLVGQWRGDGARPGRDRRPPDRGAGRGPTVRSGAWCHPGRAAPRRHPADPGRAAGQGVRQPRRVLVVRAGPAAGRVRAAAGRGRSSRYWFSTTSSPNWTRVGATGWPSWSVRPASSWSRVRWPATCHPP